MEPQFITPPLWSAIFTAVAFLFLFLFSIIGSAFSFLTAHSLIPSLVSSGHLPPHLSRVRPVFYLFSLAALAASILFLGQAVDRIRYQVLQEIFPRWWI